MNGIAEYVAMRDVRAAGMRNRSSIRMDREDMRAFHGDENLKESIQKRLDDDLTRRAIEEGPTAWRDDRGSIAGSLLRSSDLTAGPATLGIPETVLALLDYIGGHIYFAWVSSSALAKSFVHAVRPGADLDRVAATLIERMTGAIDPARLASIDASGDVVTLTEMLDAGPTSPTGIVEFIDQWLHVRSREAMRRSGWSDEQENAAQETLSRLWEETADARAGGEAVNYPRLFEEVDAELAAGYVEALNVSNASYESDATLIARWFIDAVRAA